MFYKLTKYIGLSCRRWRIRNNKTLSEIKEKTNLPMSTISNFERGVRMHWELFVDYIHMGFDLHHDLINPKTNKEEIGLYELIDILNTEWRKEHAEHHNT